MQEDIEEGLVNGQFVVVFNEAQLLAIEAAEHGDAFFQRKDLFFQDDPSFISLISMALHWFFPGLITRLCWLGGFKRLK